MCRLLPALLRDFKGRVILILILIVVADLEGGVLMSVSLVTACTLTCLQGACDTDTDIDSGG